MRVVHVVRSDAFAGTEQYVATVAREQHRQGCAVAVVGGAESSMRRMLPSGILYTPAASTASAACALLSLPAQDVLHAHMTAAEAAALIAWPRHRGAVLVTTRHFAQRRGRSVPGRLVGWDLRGRPHTEIAISQFVAERIGVPSTVLANGVRRAPRRRDLEGRSVLVMQRHEQEKQTDVALGAWMNSGLAHHGWTLTVAGRGRDTERLRLLAAELEVAEDAFVGFVADPEQLWSRTSILLSTAPEEPFGLTVVEAMARGIPVVAAAGGAHLETLGECGAFFPPGDWRQAAGVLRRLAHDPSTAESLGECGRERQQRLFDITAHVQKLLEVYEAEIARRAST